MCSIFRKQSEQITFGKSIINLIFRWKSFTIPNEINACFCSEIPQQNPTPIILKKIDEHAVLFTHNTYRIIVFNILHITNIYHILCSESYIFCSASFIMNNINIVWQMVDTTINCLLVDFMSSVWQVTWTHKYIGYYINLI